MGTSQQEYYYFNDKSNIIFNTTQNGVMVAQFDFALTNLLYNLYICSVGYIAPLRR